MIREKFTLLDRVLHYCGASIVLLGAWVVLAKIWPAAMAASLAARLTPAAGLALMACGGGLAGLGYGRALPAKIFGSLVLLLALATDFEYLNPGRIFPDACLLLPDIGQTYFLSDRAVPCGVLAFLFAGASLWLMANRDFFRHHRVLILSFFAAASLSIPLVTGYLAGLGPNPELQASGFFAWPLLLGLVLFNLGVMADVWRLQVRDEDRPFLWSSVFVGAGFVLLFLVLWRALLARENFQLNELMRLESEGLRLQMQREMPIRMEGVESFARQWSGSHEPQALRWDTETRLFCQVYPAVPGVFWIDATLNAIRRRPGGPPEPWPDTGGASGAVREEGLRRVLETRKSAFSNFLDLKTGRGFYMLAPVLKGGQVKGIIAAPFGLDIMVHRIFPQVGRTDFALSLGNGTRVFKPYLSEPEAARTDWVRAVEMPFYGAFWIFRLWPTAGAVENGQTIFPEATLHLGILLAFLLSLVIHMAQRDRLGLAELARINRMLQENAEIRERAEVSLKQSDARLRSIMDNMASGLVTLDQEGRVETLNPAASSLFGYAGGEAEGRPFDLLVPGWNTLPLPAELKGRRKQGGGFPVEVLLFEFTGARGAGQAALILDLSQRHEADRLKKQFVSLVSHELRTPLASIRGSLGLLSSGALGALPKDIRQMVSIAERNCLRLEALINDLLDLERATQGRMQLALRACSLSRAVDRSLESVSDQARLARITFKAKVQECLVMADPDRLVQVLVNLLSNAVKFSPPQADVTVSAGDLGEFVEISVADRGPGIAPGLREAIFEPFFQADSADSRGRGGSGLGLAICRAMVREFGGTLGVESRPEGGSRFWFKIPKAAGPPAKGREHEDFDRG